MCMMMLPLLSLAVGSASALLSYSAQTKAADQQNAYMMQNAQQANAALVNQYAATQNQRLQERGAADQQETQLGIKAMQARSSAVNAAGESGVSGLSVDALVNDFYGQQGRENSVINDNYAMKSENLDAEMQSQYAGTQARINSVRPAQAPSFAGALVRIAGAGVNAMTMYTRQSYYGGMGGGYGSGAVNDMQFAG